MDLHAVDDLDDALAVTRGLLLPFDLRTWAKLALVTFFVGLPSANVFQWNLGGGGGVPREVEETLPPGFGGEYVLAPRMLVLLAAIVIFFVL